MSSHALTTYLNDHLAGSVAAVELLDRLIENAEMADVRDVLTGLRVEIGDDQRTLEGVLHQMGGETSALRSLGGWLAEKAGHLKLLIDDQERGTLERLEALELLMLGIHGKRALWRALAAVQSQLPGLRTIDFGRLEKRADDQHAQVERLRLESATRVLRDDGP